MKHKQQLLPTGPAPVVYWPSHQLPDFELVRTSRRLEEDDRDAAFDLLRALERVLAEERAGG